MIAAKWDITSKCNLRCSHCSVAGLYFTGPRYRELELAAKLVVLENMARGGVTYLSLLGGEPLTLGKELLTVIGHAKRLGMRVGIVTNGILLLEDACRALVDAGLDKITVSIESTKAEQHDQIRGQGNFGKLVANINRFLAVRSGKQVPKLSVNSVLTRINKTGFVDIARFCHSLGADEWTALTLNHIGNAQTNLSHLILDPKAHTEVAIELTRQLPSFAGMTPDFTINMQLLYPLVWEYIIKNYGITPPWPQICCSAARSLVYIAPNGEMHLCDRVHGGIYGDAQIKGEAIGTVDLACQSFSDAWAAGQYARMFQFVRDPETYKSYNPCRRCKYLAAGLCEPCPLYSLEGSTISFPQCLDAEGFLGDISGGVDWDMIPANEQRGRYEAAWALKEHVSEDTLDISARPAPLPGIRYFQYPNGDAILFDPCNLQTLKLNPMASAIWESMDGRQTTREIIAHALELYTAALQSLARKNPVGNELNQFTSQTKSLLALMYKRGFLLPGRVS
jgi:MoaA/NifB/PqqE/SkfB family radical SAM enzyme